MRVELDDNNGKGGDPGKPSRAFGRRGRLSIIPTDRVALKGVIGANLDDGV